jgi:hypothetical protein
MENDGGRRTGFRWLSVFILLLAAPFCSNGQPTNLLSRLTPIPPFLELQAAARAAGIPLDGMSATTNTGGLSPGNSVTALITLHQKGNRLSQWLVYFEVVPTPRGKDLKPAKPLVLYTSMGGRFEFASIPATFCIRTIGPYQNVGDPVARDKSTLVSIDGGFLGLGMDKGAAVICRLNHTSEKTYVTNFDFRISGKPFSAARTNRNHQMAAKLHITPGEERAMASGEPALDSYFSSVSETPSLDGIMMKVVDFPSLWSILKNGGITPRFGMRVKQIAPISLQWNLPTRATVYQLPIFLTLNGRPAINAALLVTDPRPPLLACGGIVGFEAEDPDDSENYLTFRIISAR